MPHVVKPNSNSLVVTFRGETERNELTSGTISQMSWNNSFVYDALNEMFGCGKNERITAIEVTNDGIKAKFERIPK